MAKKKKPESFKGDLHPRTGWKDENLPPDKIEEEKTPEEEEEKEEEGEEETLEE